MFANIDVDNAAMNQDNAVVYQSITDFISAYARESASSIVYYAQRIHSIRGQNQVLYFSRLHRSGRSPSSAHCTVQPWPRTCRIHLWKGFQFAVGYVRQLPDLPQLTTIHNNMFNPQPCYLQLDYDTHIIIDSTDNYHHVLLYATTNTVQST